MPTQGPIRNRLQKMADLVGLQPAQFETLSDWLEKSYRSHRKLRRQPHLEMSYRRPGGGARFKDPFEHRLMLYLLYRRFGFTQEFLSRLFDIAHKSSVSRTVRVFEDMLIDIAPAAPADLQPVLAEIFAWPPAPEKRRISAVERFAAEHPDLAPKLQALLEALPEGGEG